MKTPMSTDKSVSPQVEALARAAGLDKALAEFPEDVAAAAAITMGHKSALRLPTDPTVEPWPPMRAVRRS